MLLWINWNVTPLRNCCPIWGDLFALEWKDLGTVKKNGLDQKNTLAFCLVLLHFQ